jgi:DNA-directed RNA polymerase subunit RPC12/RpoP
MSTLQFDHNSILTITVGSVEVTWRCFYCGRTNQAKISDADKLVTCKYCNSDHKLYILEENSYD